MAYLTLRTFLLAAHQDDRHGNTPRAQHLARDAVKRWLEYEPENAQLKQLLKNLAALESKE